jgi:hypothetical protein
MADATTLKIEHYTAERVPNPNPAGETPWHQYHTVRNALVRCCRKHGPTGSMGILSFNPKQPQFDFLQWERGDADPWYYIIDDQYNDERYLYVELCVDHALTMTWVADVSDTFSQFPGWGLGVVNVPDAYLLIFEHKLMVHGEPFKKCKTAEDVVEVGRRQLALRNPAQQGDQPGGSRR